MVERTSLQICFVILRSVRTKERGVAIGRSLRLLCARAALGELLRARARQLIARAARHLLRKPLHLQMVQLTPGAVVALRRGIRLPSPLYVKARCAAWGRARGWGRARRRSVQACVPGLPADARPLACALR